jgi:hypothetical protein
MKSGTLKNGFAYHYDEQNADDMTFIETLAVVMDDEENEVTRFAACGKVLGLLLGKKQKAALYAHVEKDHGGRFPLEVMSDVLHEIMDAEKN